MKAILVSSVFLIVGACATQSYKERVQDIKTEIQLVDHDLIRKYANTITVDELKDHVYQFASDAFEGRAAGTAGQKLAANFLKRYYITEGIRAPKNDQQYFQKIPSAYMGKKYNDSENVMAFIEGSDLADEVIIISGHYDHEGRDSNGNIYYGADDNGSGTAAILEMAQAFQLAKEEGKGPRRSLLFFHSTAEEIGLQGSRYYTENPIFPIENTVANLNIDMIGRIDKEYESNGRTDYLYLIGSDRLSTELHYISEAINEHCCDLELNYKFNDKDDSNRYYYRSDHYNFAKNDVPVIFYFNGEHDDYHEITDTPDKVDYELLSKRTRLIFSTAWQLANQDKRVRVDRS